MVTFDDETKELTWEIAKLCMKFVRDSSPQDDTGHYDHRSLITFSEYLVWRILGWGVPACLLDEHPKLKEVKTELDSFFKPRQRRTQNGT